MRRTWAVLLAAAALALVPAGAASAHPLGNFTVNTADRLVVGQDGLMIVHVVDLAEIPTVQLSQERAGVDTDGDGALASSELAAYGDRECDRTGRLLAVTVDDNPVGLETTGAEVTTAPGAAGLATTRLTCTYDAGARPRGSVRFDDPVARDRNGWREVSAMSTCGALVAPSVPEVSPSGLLSDYPEDLLQSPLDVTTARFDVRADAPCTAGATGAHGLGEDVVTARGLDRLSSAFTAFLAQPDLTVPFALLSVVAALAFGVLHAMAPGHGKTVMAAYLVGQRGTRRQALQLGAVVTFTHTASVLLLGAVLALGALAAPELVVPVTEVVSGVLLAAVGGYLLLLAVRRLGTRTGDHDHDHPHDHDHDHDHDQEHDRPHTHDDPHAHDPSGHDHPHKHGAPHEHDQPHDHDRLRSAVPHQAAPVAAPVRSLGAVAVMSRPVPHSHGGRTHTHAPLPDGRLSWKGLVGMGVAGGLVPSPSALLVLLSATALGRAWFGVVLVAAYGLGMAVTLTVAGLLLLRARALLDRRGWALGRRQRLVRLLPLGTAGLVVLVGLGLVLRGLASGRGLL